MTCDMCRQGEYKRIAIHSNVKSMTLCIVKCFICGYETIKNMNNKKGNIYA